MKIKQPNNLEDALTILTDFYKKDLNNVKNLKDIGVLHHSFGMWLRNNWGLWKQETPIVIWFKNEYRIKHADDISGIILDTWHRQLNGLPSRALELADEYKAHWAKNGGLK